MKHRKLRIALSVTCCIAFLASTSVWIFSYWWIIRVEGRLYPSALLGITSTEGRTLLTRQNLDGGIHFWFRVQRVDDWYDEIIKRGHGRPNLLTGWQVNSSSNFSYIQFPGWFPGLLFGFAALANWLPFGWRFSLRTLLIATTLIAVGLGMIVWATR